MKTLVVIFACTILFIVNSASAQNTCVPGVNIFFPVAAVVGQGVSGMGLTSNANWPNTQGGGAALIPQDLLHLHETGVGCFNKSPAIRLSLGPVANNAAWPNAPFAQLSIVAANAAPPVFNSSIQHANDVVLRASTGANDLILTDQSTNGAIRCATTDVERLTILNNGNVGVANNDINYVANNANVLSGGSTTPLQIRSPFQIGNITIQPVKWGNRGSWGGLGYNGWWDATADQFGLNKRLDVGPVNGIAFEPWHQSTTQANDGTTHGIGADGGVSLFACPNGPATAISNGATIPGVFNSGVGLNLRPDKLFLNMWNSSSTNSTPNYGNAWVELFDYTFPTWNSTRNDANNDGQFWIKSKVSIGNPPTDQNPDGNSWMLAVFGSVKVKELIVDKHNWSDFVFDTNYKLMPLHFLEEWIKLHGHLPDIPTQQDVTKHGIEIAETEAKLLQKVEELTLYVIQLQKEIDELKSQK